MTKKGAVDDFLSVVNPQFHNTLMSASSSKSTFISIQGWRNEDVPSGLPMGLHDHGYQLKGHGCDTLHPEGQVGSNSV